MLPYCHKINVLFSALQVLMNDYDLKERLTIMTEKGVYGNLFDNTEDKFGTGNFQVFEMEELMANKTNYGYYIRLYVP